MENSSMPWLIPWLSIYLILITILFWLFYGAIKSRNPKYGYGIAFVMLIMIVLIFL